MRVLVTGARGQLGSEFQDLASEFDQIEWNFVGRSQLDITDVISLEEFFQSAQIDGVINCAAYTAVDKAETEKEQSHVVNVLGATNLAHLCQKFNAFLIHISTDFVFSGQHNKPYTETDPTDPQGVYGQTKREGEIAIQRILPSATIIRTSWLYSSHGHNFVKTMLRLGESRDELDGGGRPDRISNLYTRPGKSHCIAFDGLPE